MKKNALVAVATLATTLGLGACATTTGTHAVKPVSDHHVVHHAAAPDPAPTPTPAVPDPRGTRSTSCSYELGNFTTGGPHGMRFTADAKLHNTGNVGLTVKLVGTWQMAGGLHVSKSKTYRLDYHQTKFVGFWRPATSDEIDAYQTLDSNTGYGDSNCHVKVGFTGTYGQVH